MNTYLTFSDAVKFFNEVGATAFPKKFPFLIEGYDPIDFVEAVRKNAQKGYDVEIQSFNDGNNIFEITINLMDGSYTRSGFGAQSLDLTEARGRGLVTDDELMKATNALILRKECHTLIERIDSKK